MRDYIFLQNLDAMCKFYPENAHKIKVLGLVGKIKQQICLPACLRDGVRLEIYITEFLFALYTTNVFAAVGNMYGDKMQDTIKISAIFNAVCTFLPCAANIVISSRNHTLDFNSTKKIIKNGVVRFGTYTSLMYSFYYLVSKMETGQDFSSALATSTLATCSSMFVSEKVAAILAKSMNKLLPTSDKRYILIDDEQKEAKHIFDSSNNSMHVLNTIYFFIYLSVALFINCLSGSKNAWEMAGITDKTASGNILASVSFLLAAILTRLNDAVEKNTWSTTQIFNI
jgi:hypothetical protein